MSDSSNNFPTEFIPVSQVLVKEMGYQVAYVWGIVWSYCQMKKGICDASHDSIAERAGMSRRSVITHIEALIEAGYIEDLTPDVRNKPHTLSVEKGMQILHSKEQERKAEKPASVQELPTAEPKEEPGMQELHSRYAEIAHPGMQILHKNRLLEEIDSKDKSSPKGEGGKSPPSPNSSQKKLLEPDTPETVLLFEKINLNRQAEGRGPAKRFKSLQQKDKCLKAAARLGYDSFAAGIDLAMGNGVVDRDHLVNWIAKYQNGANSNGHYNNSVRATKGQSGTTQKRGKFVDPDQGPDWDPFATDSG